MKRFLSVAALLALLPTLASAQVTLGNVYRLGSANDAGLPVPSSNFSGGLIYNTSTGVPNFSNGTSWQPFSSGAVASDGGTDYWFDAGPSLQPAFTPGGKNAIGTNGESLRQLDGGPTWLMSSALTTYAGNPISSGDSAISLVLANDAQTSTTGGILWKGGFQMQRFATLFYSETDFVGVGGPRFGLNAEASQHNWNNIAHAQGMSLQFVGVDGTLSFPRSAGGNAISFGNNNVRLDLGTGANDYLTSNGVGTVTPGSLSCGGLSITAGAVSVWGTDSSATPGAATIDKPSGKSAIAAAAASVVITNALVTAASRVMISAETRDATCKELIAVPAVGFFTVSGSAVCTAALVFSWQVANIL